MRLSKGFMKNLRVSRTFPRADMPGAGLPAYYLSLHIGEQQLYITKYFPGEMLPLPAHVQVCQIDFPELTVLPEKPSRFNYSRWAIHKLIGYSFFLRRSSALIRCFQPDIVHIHTPLPIGHAIWAKIFLNTKVVLTFHGTDVLRVKSDWPTKCAINRYVDTIFYVAPSMRDDLSALFPRKKLVYTPSGVDLSEFVPGYCPRKRQILAVGNLRWQKGYTYLVQAAEKVIKSRPGWKFLVAGEGPERDILEKIILDRGLTGDFKLVGTQSRESIARLYRKSAIFVLPSISEGFPKVLLEAMASGVPVITTDISCCAQVTGHSAITVPPRDPESLAKAIVTLIDNESIRSALAASGPKTAQKYSWSHVADLVHSEYRNLLNGH